jgi:hypothetical protein
VPYMPEPVELPVEIEAGEAPTIVGESDPLKSSPGLDAKAEPRTANEPTSRLPLQDIWPVQRFLEPATGLDIESPSPPPIIATSSPDTNLTPIEEVYDPQLSSTSIEVNPPRRPHPVNASQSPSGTPDHLTSNIQPKETCLLGEEPAEVPVSRREQSSASVVQRKQSNELVQTGIGPLPADLWPLIGHSQPKGDLSNPASSSEAMSGIPAETGTVRFDTTTGLELRNSPGSLPEVTSVSEPPETNLQRQVSMDGTENFQEVAPTTPVQDEFNPGLENETAQPEIDELAHRVYTQIRRRLRVEWERVRRV